ncbi:MAG: histidine kinase [Geobacteraceae bacterium GWC2_55_20]|nr:MAG: histidine kinase [Geobacteraceae bacterium GWC2_55_20]OGU25183.1 MAG: histidine kinase [Geobacteraceae bacterium GWF2_54_21]HBA71501.1 histidine kinase [Geobacter sp.]HCE69398.1 histidine kinase [Geobacter sp.]
MKIFSGNSVSTTFNLISSLLLITLFLALALSSYRREQELIIKGAVDNARAISRQIIETRDYLSRNVTKEPEQNPNLIPQVAATSIAKQLTGGSNFYVRQVSLRYRNPDNRPDSYEREILNKFKGPGQKEVWQVSKEGGKKSLRYLLPMIADQSCLACHGSYETAPGFIQERFPKDHFSYGYQVGEIIGAVSVAVPMESLYSQIRHNLKRDVIYDGIVMTIFIIITGWILHRTIITPVKKVAASISEVALTGNFSQRIELKRNDEIGELIHSYNILMSELDHKTQQRMESEERYRNFIEIAQSPIVTFMSDGKILISNQKAEKLFGLTKEELLGQCLFEFMVNGDDLKNAINDYFTAGTSDLIGTTTRQKIRDVCGRLFDVDMVISVSQSDQNQMFSAILRSVKE